jgi:hypothetical protein
VARTVRRPDLLGRASRAEVARLTREVAQLREEIVVQDAAIAAAETERDAAHAALRSAYATVEDLRESLRALRTAAPRTSWNDTYAGEPHPVTYELMAVADRLGELTGSSIEPTRAVAVGRWIGNRVRMMLARCDVAPEIRGGPVDLVRHEVVGWRTAPTPELVDHVAETVRPGYSWRGQMLRTQQVIAYAAPPVEPAEPGSADTTAHDPDSPRSNG